MKSLLLACCLFLTAFAGVQPAGAAPADAALARAVNAFLAWGRKYFEGRAKAWEYHATRRNVYASSDGKTVWFDELLDGDKGAHFMASGVLARTADGFLVEHYQLSVAVPNEVEPQVVELARAAESTAAAKDAPKADGAR
jgi:hypothetical protein